jgi:hypothetical protein
MSSKLREALEEVESILSTWIDHLPPVIQEKAREAIDKAEAALGEQRCEAKWELGAEYEFAYCSHCGHQQWASWDSLREAVENIGEFCKEYKFCPNCGFEMKGATDEQ